MSGGKEAGRGPQAGAGFAWPGGFAGDLLIVLGTFAAVTGLAALFGAANLGTALGFGQIGFGAALVYVLLRR